MEAARIKGIKSEVAGRAQILVVPDLESGNMLAKNLAYFAKADGAGIVLGARVPVVLTSRADSARSRMASCCGCRPPCRCPPAQSADRRRVTAMDTILVVNAGSSSVKFQVFAVDGEGRLRAADQGPDGWHRKPAAAARQRARRRSAGRPRLSDRERRRTFRPRWRSRAPGCATNCSINPIAVGHRVVHGGPDYDASGADRPCGRGAAGALRLAGAAAPAA